MYLLKEKKHFSVVVLTFLIFITTGLFANTDDFSDAEIKGFVNAFTQVNVIQQQMQMEMIEEIESRDMEIQRFNLLYTQLQQMPIEEIDGTEKEKEALAEITEELDVIQQRYEKVFITTIEEEGISMEKYEEIMMEVQQNPELQQRIQQEMQ